VPLYCPRGHSCRLYRDALDEMELCNGAELIAVQLISHDKAACRKLFACFRATVLLTDRELKPTHYLVCLYFLQTDR
jgi:hypothetical protein